MKRVYLANDPVSANVLKVRLEENGIQAIVQDERTHELRGEVPLVYPSVWVGNENEAAARKIALEFSHPQHGEPWSCKVCGEVLDASFSDCWKCEQTPPDEKVIPDKPASKPNNFVRGVLLFALIIVLYGVYRAYQYERFTRHYTAGYRHHEKGHFDKAIKEYDLAVALNPSHVDLLLNRASAWYAKAEFARAIQDYDRVLQLDSRQNAAYEARAYANFELGKPSVALKDFLTALSLQPLQTQLRQGITGCKYEIGDLEATWQDAEILLKAENFKSAAARYRSLVLLERNQLTEALQEADLAIAHAPADPDANLSKAGLLVSMNKYEEALLECDKAKELAKEGSVIEHTIRGGIYFRMGRIEEAKALMAEVLKKADRSRYQLQDVIVANLILENLEAAQLALDESLKRNSEDRWAYIAAAEATLWLSKDEGQGNKATAEDKAFAYLEEAKKRGFIAWTLLKRSVTLKDLVDHPRFKKLSGLP